MFVEAWIDTPDCMIFTRHLSDDDIFDTLDWQPTTCNEGAVFYSKQLMLEHREKYENDGKDPKNPQLVTVKHIKDLGFEN